MRLSYRPHKLLRHPDTPSGAIWRGEAGYERGAGGAIVVRYALIGDVGALLLPAPSAPSRADDLWKHTCFEAFVWPSRDKHYYEFNFSPSTEWAAYRFDDYRSGMRHADATAPAIEQSSAGERFELTARFVVPEGGDGVWRLGLTAVVEESSGEKSYWALGHPPGAPDFHNRGASVFAFFDLGTT